MIDSVRFDDIDSYKDLGLILHSREISAPKLKEHYVKIDGADGSVDLTDVFGEVRYENRKIKLTFLVMDRRMKFWETFSNVQNALHGKYFNIVFSDDRDFHYIGRVTLDKWKTDKVIGRISMTLNVEPYKYWNDLTEIEETVSGSGSIRLPNMRKRVEPTFEVDSAGMTLSLGDIIVQAPVGVPFTSPDLTLEEGDNWLTVRGNGRVKIAYLQGSL